MEGRRDGGEEEKERRDREGNGKNKAEVIQDPCVAWGFV